METTNTMKCVKCGGEMKEINSGTLKCQSCGEIVHKTGNGVEGTEEKEETKKI